MNWVSLLFQLIQNKNMRILIYICIEKMFSNPIDVWSALLENPEKYMGDDDDPLEKLTDKDLQ